jgi:hypothetical protein
MSRKNQVRRELLLAGGGAAAIAAMNGLPALAQSPIQSPVKPNLPQRPLIPIRQLQPRLQIPPLPISRMTGALGSVGAWGEVQVKELPSGLVPIFVRTNNKQGVLDLTKRKSLVWLANGNVQLTTKGIQIGKDLQPWNRTTISNLINRTRTDTALRISLFELRAALVTAYPHAIATSRGKGDAKAIRGMASLTKGMGVIVAPKKNRCTTTTVVETVVTTVVELVEKWKSAEERFEECVDDQVRKGIIGGEGAAVVYCGVLGLADLFLGVVEVVSEVVEEVTKTVVTCAIETNKKVIDLYKGIEQNIPRGIGLIPGIAGAAPPLKNEDITAALGRLNDLMDGISPFTTCLLQGQWSFAAVDLSVVTGVDKLEIPYGVKVCIPAECARMLRLDATGENLGQAATALVSILAALNADFAAIATPLGITAAAEAAALAGVIGATGVTALTAVAALLLFLVYFAAMIAIQIQLLPPEAFADGRVCIEHPTFVIAAVTVLLPGPGSISQFIPPIVTG